MDVCVGGWNPRTAWKPPPPRPAWRREGGRPIERSLPTDHEIIDSLFPQSRPSPQSMRLDLSSTHAVDTRHAFHRRTPIASATSSSGGWLDLRITRARLSLVGDLPPGRYHSPHPNSHLVHMVHALVVKFIDIWALMRSPNSVDHERVKTFYGLPRGFCVHTLRPEIAAGHVLPSYPCHHDCG